jgi:signal transduction histidine kinase/GAF domain-containing protein
MIVSGTARALGQRAWDAAFMQESRRRIRDWYEQPYAGTLALLVGTAFFTLFVLAIDRAAVPLPNPGIVYLPFIAMLAYHWSWRHGVMASLLQLSLAYYIFLPPPWTIKLLTAQQTEQLITLGAVDGFILILVQLARRSREATQEEAKRFAALNTVGGALAGELDERRLLRMIAQTARDLTGAGFAAFTLRPLDPLGQPMVPSEGNFFHLAAVVGVTPEQEALFRRMPLGGEGLLAPIFRYGKPVLVGDALAMVARDYERATQRPDLAKQDARNMAFEYAHGQAGVDDLYAIGVPRGHPVVRSFLGVPLLDRNGTVRGGLLLGKSEPNHFTSEDESLLTGLAAQASIALENARLYHSAQTQAQELDTIFESIADGVVLVDEHGVVLRENRTAAQLRSQLLQRADGESLLETLIRHPAELAMSADGEISMSTRLDIGSDGARDFVVSASMLELVAQNRATTPSLPLGTQPIATAPGAVVVWHDATETRRLIEERHAREEEEVRRRLLQLVLDELPSGIYLVRGPHARLVLANRAAQDLWGAEWPIGQEMEQFLAESGAEIYGPDGRQLSGDKLATVQVARTGEDVRHHQEVIRRPDTSTLPVLLNAVALDPALLGDPEGSGDTPERSALVVLQDVTALKEAERVKDEFITLAAHELKTPMAAVKGYADMLARRSDMNGEHALSDWQIEALEAIDQSTTRLVELTEDLLDVTRIQAGRLDLHTEPHDVYALVRRVTRRMQVTTNEHTIRVHASSEFIVASLDVRRMEQVLSNLLSNAIKYSPDGGEINVSVSENNAHSHAIISVHDHGIGVPANQQSHLFRRFSRADNARMLGISGTGLGLYLCREIVERQGGNIWFESEEGKGSSFCVSLPLVKEAEPAVPEGVAAG